MNMNMRAHLQFNKQCLKNPLTSKILFCVNTLVMSLWRITVYNRQKSKPGAKGQVRNEMFSIVATTQVSLSQTSMIMIFQKLHRVWDWKRYLSLNRFMHEDISPLILFCGVAFL